MDIQNSQAGRFFVSSSPGSVETPVNKSIIKRNEISNYSDQNSKSVFVKVENQTNETQNLSQVLQASSDIETNVEIERQLSDAILSVESFLQGQNRNLTFSIDEETKQSVVTVLDSDSGDVIRQIPSEELLILAERIQELQEDIGSRVGVLINNQI
ncbi:flagellar protein FlaG [Alteromonas macleodii]|uniref:flagellar protein FlaG n=1 Tax=Alteromonas macleodii TaxID=28108 RepID=UPI0031405C91